VKPGHARENAGNLVEKSVHGGEIEVNVAMNTTMVDVI